MKEVLTPEQLQKKKADNAIAARWTMVLFMIVSCLFAYAGSMFTVPAAAIAILVYIKGRTDLQ